MKESVGQLKEECRAIGRDFSKLDITCTGAIEGERAQVQEELKKFADAGVGRFVVMAGDVTPANYKARLERLASLYL
jgi:hypothetical protein